MLRLGFLSFLNESNESNEFKIYKKQSVIGQDHIDHPDRPVYSLLIKKFEFGIVNLYLSYRPIIKAWVFLHKSEFMLPRTLHTQFVFCCAYLLPKR